MCGYLGQSMGVKKLPEALAPQEAKSKTTTTTIIKKTKEAKSRFDFFFFFFKPTVLRCQPRCGRASSLRREMEASWNHKDFP